MSSNGHPLFCFDLVLPLLIVVWDLQQKCFVSDYLCIWIMMGECSGDFDNQMYVYMKKVLLAILMLTVGI